MTAILFLDFDGVMNKITPTGYVPPHPGLDRECVANVSAMVETRRMSVVCSSSWREDYDVPKLQELLRAAGGHGIAAALFDVTPIYEKVPKQRHLRAAEIADWRKANAPDRPYVIVDDSKKFGFPPEFFVRTDGRVGFQPRDADAVWAVLTRQGAI